MMREAKIVYYCVTPRREIAVLGGSSATALVAVNYFFQEIYVMYFSRETICEVDGWAQSRHPLIFKKFSGLRRKSARPLFWGRRKQMCTLDEPEASGLVCMFLGKRAHTYLGRCASGLDMGLVVGLHEKFS